METLSHSNFIIQENKAKKCFLWHTFTGWKITNEVPVWKDIFANKALGNQPNVNYRLYGKLIEQKRTCLKCGLTEIKTKTWSV